MTASPNMLHNCVFKPQQISHPNTWCRADDHPAVLLSQEEEIVWPSAPAPVHDI